MPSQITEVEKRAFFDLALGSEFRTKDLYIVEKPVAAALGEGIDVSHTPGTLIVDFGADTVEISVLAQGGVVTSRLLKIGGNTMNEDVYKRQVLPFALHDCPVLHGRIPFIPSGTSDDDDV